MTTPTPQRSAEPEREWYAPDNDPRSECQQCGAIAARPIDGGDTLFCDECHYETPAAPAPLSRAEVARVLAGAASRLELSAQAASCKNQRVLANRDKFYGHVGALACIEELADQLSLRPAFDAARAGKEQP